MLRYHASHTIETLQFRFSLGLGLARTGYVRWVEFCVLQLLSKRMAEKRQMGLLVSGEGTKATSSILHHLGLALGACLSQNPRLLVSTEGWSGHWEAKHERPVKARGKL